MNHLQIFTGYYLLMCALHIRTSFEMSPGHVHTGDQNRKSSFLCVVFEHSGTLVTKLLLKEVKQMYFVAWDYFHLKKLRELDYELHMNELN